MQMANYLIPKCLNLVFHPHHTKWNLCMVCIRKDDKLLVYPGLKKTAKPVNSRKETVLQEHFSILSNQKLYCDYKNLQINILAKLINSPVWMAIYFR